VKARGERIVASKITDLAAVLQEHVTPVYQMEAVAQLLKILCPKFEELKVKQMQQNLEDWEYDYPLDEQSEAGEPMAEAAE